VADIVDRDVIMLTSEKRHGSERRAEAEHIERRSLPLTLSNNPVFDADVLTTMRIGPTCDVAGGVESALI